MGGIQRFLIVETDVREERATTVQAPQQCHVTLTLVARITAAACQQIGQSGKDIVRNIRCLGTQIVIFFQHYFRGIFLIGAVAGVISDPDPFLTPIRLFFLFLQLPNKLITRQHALTNIFSREITRRITPGEKGDQLFKFFRRKTFTSNIIMQRIKNFRCRRIYETTLLSFLPVAWRCVYPGNWVFP